MGTPDVRIDTKLNKFLWSNGVRNVARRARVPQAQRGRGCQAQDVHPGPARASRELQGSAD